MATTQSCAAHQLLLLRFPRSVNTTTMAQRGSSPASSSPSSPSTTATPAEVTNDNTTSLSTMPPPSTVPVNDAASELLCKRHPHKPGQPQAYSISPWHFARTPLNDGTAAQPATTTSATTAEAPDESTTPSTNDASTSGKVAIVNAVQTQHAFLHTCNNVGTALSLAPPPMLCHHKQLQRLHPPHQHPLHQQPLHHWTSTWA